MQRIADTYEYQERAAIRELDGGFDKLEANQLAILDIKERLIMENEGQPQQQQESPPAVLHRASDEIELLRQQRNEIGRQMRALSDGAKKDELLKQWFELNVQILDLRKELKK